MFLPQISYFNFGQRKLAHQRCAKFLLTINITLQYNSHCVETIFNMPISLPKLIKWLTHDGVLGDNLTNKNH